MAKKIISPITGRRVGEQDVGTPSSFMVAVERTFGSVSFDLAASKVNHVVPKPDYYTAANDALHPDTQWPRYRRKNAQPITHKTPLGVDWCWLNPPYSNVYPWADRCVYESQQGRDIIMLVPASLDTAWWGEWVDGYAYWCGLKGRIKFNGHSLGYPRALALVIYSHVWCPTPHLHKHGFNSDGMEFPKAPGYLGQWNWEAVLRNIPTGG